ncbi:hypothetical protein F5882DRAFT_490771 [Hyaloscypha sp. PMI_1271]|nr:hypothetical protein F5882DRAFT_490771 [Hyaloscypha sp. PMI_1271]
MSDVESSAISQPTVARKRRSPISWSLMHPRPISRETFWVAGRSEIPYYSCSPWKFYEPFVKLKSDLFLVLCNTRTDVRVISRYFVEQYGKDSWFPEFRHPSFVDIYELYHVDDEIFAISEYLDFSLEDLLRHSIRLAEPEIAFIISRVLAGIRFIWSREFNPQLISLQNVRLSQKGDVKIDHTFLLEEGEKTSADPDTLGTLMLQLMRESKETLARTGAERWSAEAINFHIFIAYSSDPKTLIALCSMSNLIIDQEPRPMGGFLKMWEEPSPEKNASKTVIKEIVTREPGAKVE